MIFGVRVVFVCLSICFSVILKKAVFSFFYSFPHFLGSTSKKIFERKVERND